MMETTEIKKKPGRKPIRNKNKEDAKRELINAVGEIIKTTGYTGLGVNNIAKQSGLSKALIYRYFGNVNNLIEQYVVEKDFWMLASEELRRKAAGESGMELKDIISTILQDQFNFFYEQPEMQGLILWELTGKSPLMTSISIARESLGEQVLQLADEHFKESSLNFRVLSALLTAGIYYIILHGKVSTFCGVDINNPEVRESILKTIKQLIDAAFERAGKP